MSKTTFKGTISVPYHCREEFKPAVGNQLKVQVSIDYDKIMRRLADKASRSKRGAATAMNGALQCKILR